MRPPLRKNRRYTYVFVGLAALIATAITVPVFAESSDPLPPGTEECEVNELLVNSCHPWLGARASGYDDTGGSLTDQHEFHEERIGRPLDIVHTFAPAGKAPLATEEERKLAARQDTYLFQNWKPSSDWKKAAGGDESVNNLIDQSAENIKSVAPKQIFLTIFHEPENDVSSDSSCEVKDSAKSGTTQDYRDMWHNVRDRFDAAGVDNVVWVMDYMNYPAWDCLVPKLYPGDEYVDWIMFNGYGTGHKDSFTDNVSRFYDLLSSLSTANMDLESKPWGIVEWGIRNSTQKEALDYYAEAAQSLSDNIFPKLKSYMIFDSPGTHNEGGLRVGYDDNGNQDTQEQAGYTDFANHPAFTDQTG